MNDLDPRNWCTNPSDLYQAGYAGIIAYRRARAQWIQGEHGFSWERAWAAAGDDTPLGPRWVVPR